MRRPARRGAGSCVCERSGAGGGQYFLFVHPHPLCVFAKKNTSPPPHTHPFASRCTMASQRTACCLLVAALCLCPAWAIRAYGGGSGGADALTNEPLNSVAQAATGVGVGVNDASNQKTVVPALTVAAASSQIDKTPPLEITAAPRPLLVYIPFHVSEPASHIADLCECTFRRQPWRGRASLVFDVLLAISGLKSAGNEAALKTMLEDAVAHIVPRPRVFVDFVQLQSDRYIHDVDDVHKDDTWVSGPNTAFYDAFLDGHIFSKYVRHYGLVQQLETDVCALADGWLDDLTQPADDGSVLISGATIRGDCIYIKMHDRCESSQDLGDHMRHHVNGNALYHISPDLATVLSQAKAAFHNSEPFDLAIYWAMKARGMQVRIWVVVIWLDGVGQGNGELPSRRAIDGPPPPNLSVQAPLQPRLPQPGLPRRHRAPPGPRLLRRHGHRGPRAAPPADVRFSGGGHARLCGAAPDRDYGARLA